MDASTITHDAVTTVVTALASVGVTLAVFRSRLDVMEAKREALEDRIEKDRAADKELWQVKLDQVAKDVASVALEGRKRFDTTERLQRATLEIVASLAGQAGQVHRAKTTDALTRYLSDDEEPGT